MPLRFLIHSTRHSSWMYLAEPAQSQTARKGLMLSMVLPQQKRQAGLLSTMDAFACQEQNEQANTLCLSDILGQATCQQWFLVLQGFQKMRRTSKLAFPRRILSPSLSLYPVSLRGTMRERGSRSAPCCRSLIKKCPSLWSMRRRGRQLSNLCFFLLSLPSTKANQQLSSFLRRVPDDFTMIFSWELLPFTQEQSNKPQHSSLYQV